MMCSSGDNFDEFVSSAWRADGMPNPSPLGPDNGWGFGRGKPGTIWIKGAYKMQSKNNLRWADPLMRHELRETLGSREIILQSNSTTTR